ncbi:hypothetical protein [Chlorobium phaeobacteroides]|jgi:DNA invertase Pin-like site-specific DNA recombinase|uniref:Uncharacterized protein n=1 Tax=Chlorobium phaeobacteroides (strain DSM 266 / SMG 266 / 2430) TaxID=290317 RepID=A1BDK2_CHLPD|nr:hypothetical protein [Chlorobium phaeobacteroides]ABL64479.1 conserved hypothetical protein [Chlorobium phaeobacteroides DSM 266]MBV5319754.1 hypothetical protein [Chlorobium phaeobacteroides]
MAKTEMGSPDKYDLFAEKIDQFKLLVEEKKNLQEQIMLLQEEFNEKIKPFENQLSTVVRKLELELARVEGKTSEKPAPLKYSRGRLGISIKELLGNSPDRAFKPKEIADALSTKGTTVSLWLNKYGSSDQEIERIPSENGGKRFLYKIK